MSTVPISLGWPVTSRSYSWQQMCIDAWGEEFYAPDKGVYEFTGRKYESTDQQTTGIYRTPGT